MLDLIIVGGGPAAMTAALYARRAGRSVLLLEKENFGGQIASSPRVENFPTIPHISGLELSNLMFEQISALDADFDLDEVLSIEKIKNIFKVKTTYNEYEARSVIIANGVKHRKLALPGLDKYDGKGISYCAVCDGAFYAGKDVVVIGDGNSAVQYALLLSKTSKNVTIATLFDKFFADEAIVKALKSTPNITILHNISSKEYIGNGEVLTGIKMEKTDTKEEITLNCDGLFVAIGQIPDNERFANLVELNNGYISVDQNMQTKTEGLFAAGDTTDKKVRQLITSANDGAIAALSVNTYLYK